MTVPTPNPVAIWKIDDMIANVMLDIEFAESSLAGALATLQSRTATAVDYLERDLAIQDAGLAEAALKAERFAAERVAAYKELGALKRVRKAAGGE